VVLVDDLGSALGCFSAAIGFTHAFNVSVTVFSFSEDELQDDFNLYSCTYAMLLYAFKFRYIYFLICTGSGLIEGLKSNRDIAQ